MKGKLKQVVKRVWAHLKADTPKFWNWIAGLAAGIPLLVTAINESTSTVLLPKWYTDNLFYILGVAAVITFYAKSRTTNEAKEKIQKDLNP